MPVSSEVLSEGSEATNGARNPNNIIATRNIEEVKGAESATPRMSNTPYEYLLKSVRVRILTSMEHRSYMRRGTRLSLSLVFSVFISLVIPVGGTESILEVEERELVLIETIQHDSTAFTQGLEEHAGIMYESTGLYGHSGLRETNLDNGKVIRKTSIDDSYFGEGITVYGDTMIMLTWKSETAFVFDLHNLSVKGNFTYEGEGWGLCFNGQNLVMSNGSSELSFRDPETFAIKDSIIVTWNGAEVDRLNELECVDNTIYANVWGQDNILAINSSTGTVDFFVSASSLSANQGKTGNEVLNGIAFDQASGGYWITGKNWSEMYLVEFESSAMQFTNDSTTEGSSENDSQIAEVVPILILLTLSSALILRRVKHQQPPPSVTEHPVEVHNGQ